VCGPIGAGKSTYSGQLAEATAGITFSIDEWMRTYSERIWPPGAI